MHIEIAFYDSYDRIESHTTKVTGDEQTTQIHNVMPTNGSGTSAGLVAVCIVVPLFFIGLVFLCWWKRAYFGKVYWNQQSRQGGIWLYHLYLRYFTACNTTSDESDIEATGTSVISGKLHHTALYVFSNLQMNSLKPKCMLFLSVVVNW